VPYTIITALGHVSLRGAKTCYDDGSMSVEKSDLPLLAMKLAKASRVKGEMD
jgi:hypothetical protein